MDRLGRQNRVHHGPRERIGGRAADAVHEVRRIPGVRPGGHHEDRVAVADAVGRLDRPRQTIVRHLGDLRRLGLRQLGAGGHDGDGRVLEQVGRRNDVCSRRRHQGELVSQLQESRVEVAGRVERPSTGVHCDDRADDDAGARAGGENGARRAQPAFGATGPRARTGADVSLLNRAAPGELAGGHPERRIGATREGGAPSRIKQDGGRHDRHDVA